MDISSKKSEIIAYYKKQKSISQKNWRDPEVRLGPLEDTISKFSHDGNDTTYIKNLIKSIDSNQQENKMESKKYKLLESKLRKLVREEILKEEVDPRVAAMQLMKSCKDYINGTTSRDVFLTKATNYLDEIRKTINLDRFSKYDGN